MHCRFTVHSSTSFSTTRTSFRKKRVYSLTDARSIRCHSATAVPSHLGHKCALVLVERRVAGFVSVEDPQHVGYEEDQQYGSQPYAGTPTITPAAMPIVPSTAP